jgi:hypothetical protein
MDPSSPRFPLPWNPLIKSERPSKAERLETYIRFFSSGETINLTHVLCDLSSIMTRVNTKTAPLLPQFVKTFEDYAICAPREIQREVLQFHLDFVHTFAREMCVSLSKHMVPPSLQTCKSIRNTYTTWYDPAPPRSMPHVLRVAIHMLCTRQRMFFGMRLFEKWTTIDDDIRSMILEDLAYDICLATPTIRTQANEFLLSVMDGLRSALLNSSLMVLWMTNPKLDAETIHRLILCLKEYSKEGHMQSPFCTLLETFLLVLHSTVTKHKSIPFKEDIAWICNCHEMLCSWKDSVQLCISFGHLYCALLNCDVGHEHIDSSIKRIFFYFRGVYAQNPQDARVNELNDIQHHILVYRLLHYANDSDTERSTILWETSSDMFQMQSLGFIYRNGCAMSFVLHNWTMLWSYQLHQPVLNFASPVMHFLRDVWNGIIPPSKYTTLGVMSCISLLRKYHVRGNLSENLLSLWRKTPPDVLDKIKHFFRIVGLNVIDSEFLFLKTIPKTKDQCEYLWSIVCVDMIQWKVRMDWWFSLVDALFAHGLVHRHLLSNTTLHSLLDKLSNDFPEKVAVVREKINSLRQFRHIHPAIYQDASGNLEVDTMLLDESEKPEEDGAVELGESIGCMYPESTNDFQKKVLDILHDPIMLTVMKDPVLASDMQTYDRGSISMVIQKQGLISPVTRLPITRRLIPNLLVANIITDICAIETEAETRVCLRKHLSPNGSLLQNPGMLGDGTTVEASDEDEVFPNYIICSLLSLLNE